MNKYITCALDDLKTDLTPFEYKLLSGWKVKLFRTSTDIPKSKYWFIENGYLHTALHLINIPMIHHEIAHCVELKDKKRWMKNNWGFNFGFKKFAATAREARVQAIHLLMRGSIANDPHRWIKGQAANYKVNLFSKFKSKQEVEDYLIAQQNKIRQEWNLDRIELEWKIRMEYIHERL